MFLFFFSVGKAESFSNFPKTFGFCDLEQLVLPFFRSLRRLELLLRIVAS